MFFFYSIKELNGSVSKSWDYSAAGISARRSTVTAQVGEAVRAAANVAGTVAEIPAGTPAGSAPESAKKRALEDDAPEQQPKRRKLEAWAGFTPVVDDKWVILGASLGAWYKGSCGIELDTETQKIYWAEKGEDGLNWKDVLN